MASDYIAKIIEDNEIRHGDAVTNDTVSSIGYVGAVKDTANTRVAYESDSIKGRYGSDNGDIDDIEIDSTTHALRTITYAHSEIHSGHSFSIHHYSLDFDSGSEIGILFTTPDTVSWLHCVPLVSVPTTSLFEILEDPVVYTDAYPTVFYTPRNRNRNSAAVSAALSVRAAPSGDQVSLKEKADDIPATSGYVIHAEAFGAAKNRPIAPGIRDTDEYILKQNTTYYFRLRGNGTGVDDTVATMELTWYEHSNKHGMNS